MWLNFGKRLQMLKPEPIKLHYLNHSLLQDKGIQVAILRLDQVHAMVSGNKFFKLKYNLQEAKRQGKNTILTFGGAFSNHIYATASAAHLLGMQSIGIVRGEDLDKNNPTLAHAQKMGMQLHFVDREDYRRKKSPEFLKSLETQFGEFYFIPEGGTNELAIQGTQEILKDVPLDFTHICVCIGTGGTFAGLASSLKSHQKLVGFSALKGEFIHEEISNLLKSNQINSLGSSEIKTDYHFGGYGKYKPELTEFLGWFYKQFKIPLDPIYTGKMMFGTWNLIEKDFFETGSKILVIHSGGLQGNAGFAMQTGINLPIL